MVAETWKRIEEVFDVAMQRDRTDRPRFLDQACGDDESLRGEVESLLALVPRAERMLGTLSADAAPQPPLRPASADALGSVLGRRIGAYRIQRVIAVGGMGIVYEAEQDKPRRTVAVKVIKSGLASAETVRRFEYEAQVLARLQHPGIAQIFEAGHTDAGNGAQPYFAMEYIEGLPLTEYADAHRLSTRRRLELFLRVCDAVQYAHQKGVIHRDLKPANIIVQEELQIGAEDGASSETTLSSALAGLGQPKILDFGVACATYADVDSTTRCTSFGQLIGTLQYMSPEQCQGDPYELDTRSDVYALGLICFELLAERPPYDLSKLSIPDAARVITEQIPPRLRSINRAFRGDLDAIMRKALEKDKTQRYQSASDLAEDVRRFLRDQPILARSTSIWYQARKFMRRNTTFVGVAAAALAFLIGGVAALTAQSLRSQNVANVSDAALKVHDLMKIVARHDNDTDRSTVDQIAKQVEVWDEQARQPGGVPIWPAFEHQCKDMLGVAYYKFTLYDVAEPLLRRALDVSRDFYGENHQWTLRSVNVLFDLRRDQGELKKAEKLLQSAFDACKYSPGNDPDYSHTREGCIYALRLLRLSQNLGELRHLQGLLSESEQIYRATLDSLRRVLEADKKIRPKLYAELSSIDEHHSIRELNDLLDRLLRDIERLNEAGRKEPFSAEP